MLIVAYLVERYSDPCCDHMLWIETRIYIQDANEASNQQPGAYQQHESNSCLRDYQSALNVVLRVPTRHGLRSIAKSLRRSRPGGAPCGKQTEHEAGYER